MEMRLERSGGRIGMESERKAGASCVVSLQKKLFL